MDSYQRPIEGLEPCAVAVHHNLGVTRVVLLCFCSIILTASSGCTGAADVASATPAPTTASGTVIPERNRDLADRPEARLITRWAAAFGRAVNSSDRSFAAVRPMMTEVGLGRMELYTAPDWGRYFPGPLPLRVVALSEPDERGIVMVEACVQTRGPQKVVPVTIGVVQRDELWLVDGMGGRTGNCAGVTLPDARW